MGEGQQTVPHSAVATDVARRLWARTGGDASTPEAAVVVVERICSQLRAGLGRWIGAQGYRALLNRAHEQVRADHPALADLPCIGGAEGGTTGTVHAHGVDEVATGLIALVAALIELLGRIIGEEMSVRLVEQIGVPSPRGVVSNNKERAR